MKQRSATVRIRALSSPSRRPSSLELESLSQIPNRKRSLEAIRQRKRPRDVLREPRHYVRFGRPIEPMKCFQALSGCRVLAARQMDLRRRQQMLRFEAQELAIDLGTGGLVVAADLPCRSEHVHDPR